MSDSQTIESRKKEIPTLDELTTLIWTPEMGKRLSLVRMKMLKEQKELARDLRVSQGAISRIEIGHSVVCEKITIKSLRLYLGTSFSFVVFGTNPERYNEGVIKKTYWDTRLRIRRKNVSPYSKSRIL